MNTIPFCGQTYQERTVNLNAQRCVNLYPYFDSSSGQAAKIVLYPTPGYSLFLDCTGSQVRGLYELNSTLYAVVDASFYSITSAGVKTLLGTLSTTTGPVSIVDNTVQIAICDGTYGYTYTLSGGAFAKIVSAGFPASPTLFTYQDSYVLTSAGNANQVNQSNALDASTWSTSAIVQPLTFTDNIVAPFSDGRELFILGRKGTEVRYDSGATPFAFDKRTDVIIQMGCTAVHSIKRIDNSIMWLSRDERGHAFVIKLDGYTPKIVSTPAINEAFERYSTVSDAQAFVYKEANSQFYVLTFPTANATWAYDVSTGQWHERSTFNVGRDLANCYAFAFGKHIVGDYASGKLYYMSLDYLDNAGGIIQRQRACQHQEADGQLIFLHELQVDIETGVGLVTGQGSSPLATLEISIDHGHTWLSTGTASMGAIGEYRTRLVWRNLGYSEVFTFRLTVSDPVKVYILGARARYTMGGKF